MRRKRWAQWAFRRGARTQHCCVDLSPGVYSMQVKGATDVSGIALLEVFDVSTRPLAGSGESMATVERGGSSGNSFRLQSRYRRSQFRSGGATGAVSSSSDQEVMRRHP